LVLTSTTIRVHELRTRRITLSLLLSIAICFGVLTGIVEGAGLLIFQKINSARWGPMLHVSAPIVWIAVIVDVLFFCLLGLLVLAAARLWSRVAAVPSLAFVLGMAATYDWLSVTGRLYRLPVLILAIGVGFASARWAKRHEKGFAHFCRGSAPWVVAMAVLVFAGIEGSQRWAEDAALAKLPAATAGTPNVIVLVVDTLRADHLSSYGYNRPTSPNMDRLASQGVLFENAISPSSWSFPSHVSLVTGLYQFQHGMGNVPHMSVFSGPPTFSDDRTIGEEFESRGYRTAAFSANRTYFSHSLGFGRGFTHFEDYFHCAADGFVRTLYGRKFSRIYLSRSDKSKPKRVLRWLGWNSLLDPDEEGSGSYGGAEGVRKRASVVNDELFRWIERAQQKHPFFAFLNYFDVHGKYGGPRNFAKPPWPQDSDIDKYDDGIKYVDDMLGQLMAGLQQRGLTQNTIVVVTSDHGESLGQHHLSEHGLALYWELVHVPLIFWYPGHIPAGVRVSTPVTNADIGATLLNELGGKSELPGQALSTLWNNPNSHQAWPAPLSEVAENPYPGKINREAIRQVPTAISGAMKSIVTPQWQLIIHRSRGDQLYDYEHDPAELKNVADSTSGEEIARQLKLEIEQRVQGSSAPNPGESPQAIGKEIFASRSDAAQMAHR
jgi:arylsulfatase A-like enzyme